MLNALTQALVHYCETTSNIAPFVFAEHCQQIHGKSAFVKLPLSATLIGLVLVNAAEYKTAARGAFTNMEIVGFYATTTGKLYLRESLKHSIAWYYPQGEVPEFPIQYEPIPVMDMLNSLGKEVTNILEQELEPVSYDINNPNDIERATSYFFDEKKEPTNLSVEDFQTYFCKDFVYESLLTNNDIAEYLLEPERWSQQTAEKVLENEEVRKSLYARLQILRKVSAILAAIRNDPDHYWHKVKRLLAAIQGKKNVVVRLKDGVEFKMNTAGLEYYNGIYSDYYIAPEDRAKVRLHFSEWSSLSIKDIQTVLYRGKTIYDAKD